VALRNDAVAAGFDAGHAHAFVIEEGMEEADRVAAAADAGDEQIGQALLALQDLAAGLDADHAVEIAHHHREGMRAERGAEDVVRGAHVRDPVAHGLVDGLLERGLAGGDGDDFGPEEAHAGDVERLALHIDLAHVDDAFHAEAAQRWRWPRRADRRRSRR
jgi:hypothetical protein